MADLRSGGLHSSAWHFRRQALPFGYTCGAKVIPMPDAQPGQTFETGDIGNHEDLVRANIGWMLALAERLLRDRGLAEDVVQEAFVRAFDGLAKFEGRSTLESWLHRITVNTSLSKLRQVKRLAEQSIDEHLPEFDRHECRVEAAWSHLATVDEIMESEELKQHVHIAIGKLPDAYRVVLQLRDIEDYDTSEVAALLDITKTNAKVRLHRARAALKKILEPVLRAEESK